MQLNEIMNSIVKYNKINGDIEPQRLFINTFCITKWDKPTIEIIYDYEKIHYKFILNVDLKQIDEWIENGELLSSISLKKIKTSKTTVVYAKKDL